MRFFILGFFVVISLTSYTQNKSLINTNKAKIEELNARLDRLSPDNNHEKDSLLKVISELRQQLINSQTQLIEAKNEVLQLQKQLKPSGEQLNLSSAKDKTNAEDYYVIIKSYRNKALAERATQVLSNSYGVRLVQNRKKTWYHVIESKSYSMYEAKKQAAKFHAEGRKEVWWTTGRKLELD